MLEEAESRGVDVKLLLPGKSDVAAAHYVGRAFFTKLLQAGVEVYTYQGEILHAKTAVFDGVWSVIGSANLDFQSLRKNDEGNVGIFDQEFGRQMIEIFKEDLKHSVQINFEAWSNRPLLERVRSSLLPYSGEDCEREAFLLLRTDVAVSYPRYATPGMPRPCVDQ